MQATFQYSFDNDLIDANIHSLCSSNIFYRISTDKAQHDRLNEQS